MRRLIFIFLAMLLITNCQTKDNKQVQWAHGIIKKALAEKNNYHILVNKPITDRKIAIKAAEPILFKEYGKDQIISEKPYNVYFVDSYWILTGTLPKGYMGGTFLIILSAKDGSVIKLTHYK